MNTYLVPVTKEHQSVFTDIMVIYANNESDAYFKAKIEKGLIPITIMDYHDVPYDFFEGELQFSASFFPVSRKHDIEINQIVDDYCYENGLESCFTLDAIEHDKTVRKLFESLVDGLLEKYDLFSEHLTVKEKTIFDD